MKKLTILLIAFTLAACEYEEDQIQANDKDLRILCIDGLSYLTYQGSFIKNFLQIYVPAENPAYPPQPKVCKTKVE